MYFDVMLFPLSLLWAASRRQQVRCIPCDTLYLIETRRTYIAAIVFWIFVLLVLLGIFGQQFAEKS